MSRTTLLRITLVAGLLALGLCLTPFVSSFSPSERAHAVRPRVALPELAPGQFAYVADPRYPGIDLMFVRKPNGHLNVWYVSVRDGVHLLPDFHWWRPGRPCKNLSPQFDKGVITCADSDLPEWYKSNYLWTLDGKALSQNTTDMLPSIGNEEMGDFVFGKRGG